MIDEKLHKQLAEIFEEKLIRDNEGASILCDIYDKLTKGNEMHANCLGENLNQLIQFIRNDFFSNYSPNVHTSAEFYFGTYIYWLYLIVERFEFIFEVINPDSKSKLIRDFKETNFKSFKEVKDWCIFYKHPKEFVFCHWPIFIIKKDEEQFQKLNEIEQTTVIDTEYVSKNFTKNGKRLPNLENNQDVIVLIPDLVELTNRYIDDLKLFINFICKNELIVDFLRKKSTIEDYYKFRIILEEEIAEIKI